MPDLPLGDRGAVRLYHRHRRRDRCWFISGCALTLVLYDGGGDSHHAVVVSIHWRRSLDVSRETPTNHGHDNLNPATALRVPRPVSQGQRSIIIFHTGLQFGRDASEDICVVITNINRFVRFITKHPRELGRRNEDAFIITYSLRSEMYVILKNFQQIMKMEKRLSYPFINHWDSIWVIKYVLIKVLCSFTCTFSIYTSPTWLHARFSIGKDMKIIQLRWFDLFST